MNRKLLFLLLCSVPALIFLNVWEVFRFETLKNDVAALEQLQKEWMEKNKRMIAAIAVLSSPGRIEKLAREELNLSRPEPGKMIFLETDEKKKP